jgi:hypothetical protein
MIKTRSVRDRRRLRFDSFEAAVKDAEALAAAERTGALRNTGNWQLGQALGHLAFWADAPFDGYPNMPRPPWLIKKMILLMKKRIIFKTMGPGIRIRGVEAGTFGLERMPADEGLGRMRRAYNRLASQAPSHANPIFGELTHAEWIGLNLRHAELHLSFFHPA